MLYKKLFLFLFVVVATQAMQLSCTHIFKTKGKDFKESTPRLLESRDGLIKTEQILISDPYDKKISKLLGSAYIHYKDNNFLKAIVNYEAASMLSQSLDFWHSYALAYCYLTVGRFQNSIKILEELIEERPEIADSYILLGVNYLRIDKLDLAIDTFNRVLTLEYHPPRTYYYLGLAQKYKNPKFNPEEVFLKAIAEYKEILKKNPNDFETLIEISYIYLTKSDIEQARSFFEQAKNALNISPEVEEIAYVKKVAPYQDPIWLHFYLNLIEGIILHKEEKYLDSNHTFLVALQTPPSGSKFEIARIYFYLSENFKLLKDQKASEKALSLALELDPLVIKHRD